MGVNYQAVLWNRQKKLYDLVMIGFILAYLVLFIVITLYLKPEITQETLIIRSTSTLALLMLHVILAIGPLCRISDRFLPLLYNRRHLGVTMFIIAAVHGLFSILQFHTLGNVNPLESLFTSNMDYGSLVNFPFQVLGFFALLIFFLMAATSHDFWLHNLSPRVWKSLHMLVYVAYLLIVFHVLLGILQDERPTLLVTLLTLGGIGLVVLHLYGGFVRSGRDRKPTMEAGFIEVGKVGDIPEDGAVTIFAKGERVAIFKYDGKISAISNVCKHQNGPLGEGKIIDGCITCPWHGYQYLPQNGCSPPPFTEKVATYRLKLEGDNTIWLNPEPLPEGTEVKPIHIHST